MRRGLKRRSPLDCSKDGSTRVLRWRCEGQGAGSVDSFRRLILGILSLRFLKVKVLVR